MWWCYFLFNSTLKHGKGFKQKLDSQGQVTFHHLTCGVTMENIVNLNCKLSVFLLILFGIFACNFSYDKWSEFDAGGEC